uniref:Uncharacterized protein n=1 Tax=Rhizophora mucronata TaxID=61149 RepID=A0A2P2PJA8_RHIMU
MQTCQDINASQSKLMCLWSSDVTIR